MKSVTIGTYKNFPPNIHMVETFNSNISIKQLQQRLIQVFLEANGREFSFEEVAIPTIPDCKLIFEFGLADAEGFSYIDKEEAKNALNLVAKEQLSMIDFFCAIRYYKVKAEKKTALKFDYYLLRTLFSRGLFEIQIFHDRGPRYISPKDLTEFISLKANEISNRKILKKANQ
jgi:hypothetical protein